MSVSEIQIFEARIEGVQQAASRARGVFLAVTVIASTTVASCFTTYFSWMRNYGAVDFQLANKESVTYLLQTSVIKSWVDSSFVTVPGLGARLSITDAAVWATGGLLISALWLFFCLRRENHLIGYVLTDAHLLKDEIPGIYPLVVHSIRASQVFATGSARNTPFSSIKDVTLMKENPSQGRSILEAIPRGVMVGLMGLPALGCFCVLACDVLSVIYLPALFRGSNAPIGWDHMRDNMQFLLMVGFNVLMLVSCLLLGILAGRYQLATRKLVSETVEILKSLAPSKLEHLPLLQLGDNQQSVPAAVAGGEPMVRK